MVSPRSLIRWSENGELCLGFLLLRCFSCKEDPSLHFRVYCTFNRKGSRRDLRCVSVLRFDEIQNLQAKVRDFNMNFSHDVRIDHILNII